MLSSRLAFANMRKKKGTSITLVVFMILATICLNLGIKINQKCENMVEEKAETLATPDLIATCIVSKYKPKYEEYLQMDERVDVVEKEELIYMPTTKNNQNTLELGALIFNSEATRKIAPFQLVEEDPDVPKDKAIYVPLLLKGYGVKLGTEYDLKCKGIKNEFIVAGFFETTYYGTSMSGMLKYYVPDCVYQKLYTESSRAYMLSVRLKGDVTEREQIIDEFTKEFKKETDFGSSLYSTLLGCHNFIDMKSSCMTVLSVLAAILIAFAFLLCTIILVVIVYRVVEHIEENMQNIGILQAIGYTSKHIIGSVIIEFILLGFIGGVVGNVISYFILPVLKSTFANFSGLVSEYFWNPWIDLSCLFIILAAIILAAGLASLRILKLPPVKALNRGRKTHHFGKNNCPLYKGFGKVHFRIALKNIVNNKKSNLMYTLVIACSMFIIGLTLTVYENFSTDRTMMFQMLGFELSDLQVKVTKQTNAKDFSKELLQMEEVRKTNLSDIMIVNVEDVEVKAITSDDFSQMEVLKPYEGTLPKYENEIVLTGILSDLFHKKIGDTVVVSAEGRTKEFYVCGIYQSSNDIGYMVVLPYEGVVQLRPQYEIGSIDVYLKDGVDKDEFKQKLRTIYKVAYDEEEQLDLTTNEDVPYSAAAKKAEEKISKLLADYGIDSISYTVMQDGEVILAGDSFDYKIDDIGDYYEFGNGQLDTFTTMVVGIVGVVTVIILVIVGGILSITIKSMLRKKKEEYGIFKALGYTTKEIIQQISMNFALTALLGVVLGGILISSFANDVLGGFFLGMGLTHLIFAVPYATLFALALGLIAFTMVMALVKAYQVKKITPYDLLTE